MTFGLACDRDGYDLRFPRPNAPKERRDLDRLLFGRVNVNLVMTRFGAVPNRLYGTTINEHGEAV